MSILSLIIYFLILLSITYGIIDKLGGKVSVESEIDKGTTFIIEIPIESRL